jgi:flagellar motor protein MotB
VGRMSDKEKLEGFSKNKDSGGDDDGVERDSEAWMDTLSDLIFLMITFFVLLITMSSMDKKMLKEAFGILDNAAGVMSFPEETATQRSFIEKIVPIAKLDFSGKKDSGEEVMISEQQQKSHELLKKLREGLISEDANELYDTIKPLAEDVDGNIQVLKIKHGVEVVVAGRMLFLPGKTELTPMGKVLIQDVATILQAWDSKVRIVAYWPWHEGADVLTSIIRVLDKNRIKGETLTPEIIPGMQRNIRFILRKGPENG